MKKMNKINENSKQKVNVDEKSEESNTDNLDKPFNEKSSIILPPFEEMDEEFDYFYKIISDGTEKIACVKTLPAMPTEEEMKNLISYLMKIQYINKKPVQPLLIILD